VRIVVSRPVQREDWLERAGTGMDGSLGDDGWVVRHAARHGERAPWIDWVWLLAALVAIGFWTAFTAVISSVL
jgi:hypothetical protein